MMEPTHPYPLYGTRRKGPHDFAVEITRLTALHGHSELISSAAFHRVGRNRITRSIDKTLEFIRRYLPPIHWVAVKILAVLLYGYARAIAATAKIVTVGSRRWPDVPKGSVLAIWHGSIPSLLAAFTAHRPSTPLTLMVSRDPRGDCVAQLCRWLGFEIIRGDAEHGGLRALIEIANDVHNGGVALISPDGGGPPFVTRVGAIALASATQVRLIPIGADCRPSVFERHKWDKARNPLPYGRIAVVCGEPLLFPAFEDAAALEGARLQVQAELVRTAEEARSVLGF
ncbi:MAG TPA: DUF374 domain-containing protein [Bryobacteraceae bacterium]|nr:DUF374 domain-containing protein [Bryobacteraceae bacterium]